MPLQAALPIPDGLPKLPLLTELGQRFDSAEQVFLARHPGDLIAKLAVLEKQQRRNRPDVVLEGKTLVLIDIHFGDLHRIGFFARDFIEQGRD